MPQLLPTLGSSVPSSDQDAFDWQPFSQALQTADAMLTANSKLIDAGAIKSKTTSGAAFLRSPGGGSVASWQAIATGDLPSGIPRANLALPTVDSTQLASSVALPNNAFTDLLTLSFTTTYPCLFWVMAGCTISVGTSSADGAIDLALWLGAGARNYVARARDTTSANGDVALSIAYPSWLWAGGYTPSGYTVNIALQGVCSISGGSAQASNQIGGRSGIPATWLAYIVL